MVVLLKKTRYSNRGSGTKYYMDCSKYATKNDALQIKNVIQNKHHITVLEAIVNDDTIISKNKHIVIKICQSNKTATKEYTISELLYNNKIQGFIKYNCIFTCYDNTEDKIPEIVNTTLKYDKIPSKICDADKTYENKKDVLIMPYVKDGSIEKYEWTQKNIHILKNLIMNAIMSLTIAFQKTGFIHGDLHLGNLLIKKTTKKEITYNMEECPDTISVPTLGYRTIITDFEKSMIGIDKNELGIATFWDSLSSLCKKINVGLENTNEYSINWENANILLFLKSAINNKSHPKEVLLLLNLITETNFTFTKIVKYSYNSNSLEPIQPV